MDPTTLLATYGPWAFLAYVLIKDVLPNAFPQLANAINKRVSTEERLFQVLATVNTNNASLAVALSSLQVTLSQLATRVEHVEDVIINQSKDRLILPSGQSVPVGSSMP